MTIKQKLSTRGVRMTQAIIIFVIILCWLWAGLALYFAGPNNNILNAVILLVFITILPLAFYVTRSFNQTLLVAILVFAVFQIWWVTLPATNNKTWAADVAKIPYGEIINDQLTLNNVRNFEYRSETDFTQRWETRHYDLSKLQSLDLFISYWGSPHIAHTIMSWGFENGDYLAISIEARKDSNQRYSAIKGFFKQFNLVYVAADEQDLIRLRTHYRKEQVYFYRLQKATISNSRALLESYIYHMNRLQDKPEFYHALTLNCTSAITLHSQAIGQNTLPSDWRLTVNGYLDELLYEQGSIRNDKPFAVIRKMSLINQRVENLQGDVFSHAIRDGLVLHPKNKLKWINTL